MWCTVSFVALTVAVGCAHRKAIDAGDEYAEAGDWREAVAAYREAKEARPNSDTANRKLREAKQKAAARALERAEAAIGDDRYGEADRELEYVEEIDAGGERAAAVAADARSGMADAVRARIDEGKTAAAYRLHRQFGEYFPEHTDERPAREELREREFRRTDRLADEGDWEEALERLEVMAKHEPERVEALVDRRRSYRKQWADNLVGRAREHRDADRSGAAALLYAEAYRVTGDEKHFRDYRRLASGLRRDGMVAGGLRFVGAGAEGSRIRETVVEQVGDLEGLNLVGDRPGELEVTVDVEPVRCETEQVGSHTDSKRYLAGTKQVRNPLYERRRRELRRHRRDIDRLERLREQAHHTWHHKKEDLERFDRQRLQRLQERHRRLERELERHERLVAELERKVDSARRRHRRLRQCNDCPRHEVRAARDREDHLEDRLHDEERDHREGEQSLRELERDYRRMERKWKSKRRETKEARRKHERLEEKYRRALDEERRMESWLDQTPRTKTKKIWKDFEYRVREWRRRCGRRLEVRASGPGNDDETAALERTASTTDESHDGFDEYGVERDPRSFPQSRSDLVTELDSSLSEQLVARIEGALERVVAARVESQLERAGDAPHRATDRLLGAVLASGPNMDEETRRAIDSHFSEHYGVGLETLERIDR